MLIEEILVIKQESIYYGIETTCIEQILRVPTITPLVLSPSDVRGLCAVSGSIATVIDLNIRLGFSKCDLENDKARLLSLTTECNKSVLLVDEVINSIEVDQDRLEVIDEDDDYVCAIYNTDDSIIQILSLDSLLNNIKPNATNPQDIKNGTRRNSIVTEDSVDSDRYLIFSMKDEKFSVHIDNLREIVRVPDEFNDISSSAPEVEGIFSLRGELLVVIDLRKYYNYKVKSSDKNRVLVVNMGSEKIGLIVDDILAISDFEKREIDNMPANFEDQKISGIIHSNDELISIIGEDIISKLITAHNSFENSSKEIDKSETIKTILEVVIFKLFDEEYAMDIECVREIIDLVDITKISDAPKLVDGVINIRGQVVPVGSLYERLKLEKSTNRDSKIIITNISGSLNGFCVDSISDIIDIKDNEISKNSNRDELFSNVLHLENGKRLVLLIDQNKIFQKDTNG
ncbi:MAG: chemotaxis protein CheW [Campylobacterota bacterium]|nr:chemotaxis protein CheW [Campylobacterota bacterium]